MGNFYDIKIGDEGRIISVAETSSKEITISGHVYIVPAGVVQFIEEMAGEIHKQQQRRVATDKELTDRIGKRIDRILRSLSERGLLSDDLNADYPLPPNVEVSGGQWTFFDEAREVAKEGLKNAYKDNLVDDIGGEFEQRRGAV